MLLSPIVSGHCQGQILLLWQNPIPLRLRGYHPLRQHVPEHFSSEKKHPIRHSTPHLYHVTVADSVWAIPFSLAATSGISLISFPRPTQMLHFGRFALPSEKQGSVKRDLIRKSRINGRMHFPRAYRSLPRPSSPSRVIPQPASSHYNSTPFFFLTTAAPKLYALTFP